jgi:hypothetical protein
MIMNIAATGFPRPSHLLIDKVPRRPVEREKAASALFCVGMMKNLARSVGRHIAIVGGQAKTSRRFIPVSRALKRHEQRADFVAFCERERESDTGVGCYGNTVRFIDVVPARCDLPRRNKDFPCIHSRGQSSFYVSNAEKENAQDEVCNSDERKVNIRIDIMH